MVPVRRDRHGKMDPRLLTDHTDRGLSLISVQTPDDGRGPWNMDLGEDWEMGGDQERQGRPRDDGWMPMYSQVPLQWRCRVQRDRGTRDKNHGSGPAPLLQATKRQDLSLLLVFGRFRLLLDPLLDIALQAPHALAGWLAGWLAGGWSRRPNAHLDITSGARQGMKR